MKFKIRYVDGLRIRNRIDPNFGVVGSSRIYPFIPIGEIWFDRRYMAEKKHFIRIHLYELMLMKKMTYEQARKIIEKKFVSKIDTMPNFIIKKVQYKGYLLKYVDGRIIRKYLDPKFILGCHSVGLEHGIMSKFMGKKEIWVDLSQDKLDQKYSLIHEYSEAELMKKGMSYNDAHDYALAAEKQARRKDGAVYLQD